MRIDAPKMAVGIIIILAITQNMENFTCLDFMVLSCSLNSFIMLSMSCASESLFIALFLDNIKQEVNTILTTSKNTKTLTEIAMNNADQKICFVVSTFLVSDHSPKNPAYPAINIRLV
jgi:hypothetical protein